MIQESFQNTQRGVSETSRAHTRAREKTAFDQINGFVGSTGCRVRLLRNMEGLRRLAARMFVVTDDGSPDDLASRIDALGRDARRAAAQTFVARHHPLPDDLFPADARARRSTPSRQKRSDQVARATSTLIRGEAHSRHLEAAATRFLERHPLEAPKPLPLKVVEPVIPPMKKAKRRKLMNREAQRKQAAGIPLSKAEQWEIDRRARQKVFRTDKRHRRAAQRAVEVTAGATVLPI